MKQERIDELLPDTEYSQGMAGDGVVFIKNGEPMKVDDVIDELYLNAARVQLLAKALKVAREDIEAWREFCKDMGQGVGFGHSDLALETIDAALKEAGLEG